MTKLKKQIQKLLETKSAPKGFHFTKDGKLKRGDADRDGSGGPMLRSDPLDKQRSKVPPVSEAVSVKKANYSWGKMVTVHHGSDTSYPLHPEHQKEIAKLRDGDKTAFKDETGRRVHVHREGNKIHLMSKEGGYKPTTVDYKHFEEGNMSLFKQFRTQLEEKTLTPAEKKKREEVAKAIERENPNMPMGMKMAIATKTAKRVAEENISEAKDKQKELSRALNKLPRKPDTEYDRKVTSYLKKKYNKEEVELEEAKGLAGMSLDQLKQEHDKVKSKIETEGKSKMISMNHPLSQRARAIRLHMAIKAHKGVNEAVELINLDESVKTTHENPLVTVHNKHNGKWELHTHAHLSTANHIFQTNVKHGDVHKGPVEVKSGGSYGNVKFAISQHHAKAVEDEKKFKDTYGESVEENADQHYCAKHVRSSLLGDGIVLEAQHADPDENGNIEWYLVEFKSGIRKVYTEDLEIMIAEYHGNHKKKRMTNGR